MDQDEGNTILFGFDLTPDMSEVGAFQLIKQGNLRVEIHFAEALTTTINVIMYAEFDNVIEIDRNRQNVFKRVYARNRLPRRLNVPSALIGNTDPDDRAYVNFMNKHCTSWTYNTIRVQEEGSTVCGHHCIFYLIHRCAGKSMGDVTRTLRHPGEATDIVKTFVHRLINKA